MIRSMFKKGPATKADVVMAVAAAIIGVWKATDTIKDYKSANENEENEK